MVAVERKTCADLVATLTRGRKRFLAELERLRDLDRAWVIVEAEYSQIIQYMRERSHATPKVISRSLLTWQVRYSGIHWIAVPGRAVAEAMTYHALRTWWKDRVDAPAKALARKRAAKRQDPEE